MSLNQHTTVTCSKCNYSYPTEIYTAVNVSNQPYLREKVMTGEIFITHCSHCNHLNQAVQNLLYHDMKKKFMIWLIHPEDLNEVVLNNKSFATTADTLGDVYTLRVVRTPLQLREKINLLEAGLDDRFIELKKFYYKLDQGYSVETAEEFVYFESSDDDTDPEIIMWLVITESQEANTEVLDGQLDNYAHNLLLKLEPSLEKGWYIVDWQFPFGVRVQNETTIDFPARSEVIEIPVNEQPKKVPKHFLEFIDRTLND